MWLFSSLVCVYCVVVHHTCGRLYCLMYELNAIQIVIIFRSWFLFGLSRNMLASVLWVCSALHSKVNRVKWAHNKHRHIHHVQKIKNCKSRNKKRMIVCIEGLHVGCVHVGSGFFFSTSHDSRPVPPYRSFMSVFGIYNESESSIKCRYVQQSNYVSAFRATIEPSNLDVFQTNHANARWNVINFSRLMSNKNCDIVFECAHHLPLRQFSE